MFCSTSSFIISFIYFFSELVIEITLDLIRIAIFFDKLRHIRMKLFTILQEILEIVVIIGDFLEQKVLLEGLPHVEDLAVLAIILLE